MTTEEKINLLNEYDNIPVLTDEHFSILNEFSYDKDSNVRSIVASLLVDFINERSKDILLRLAQDEDYLVRTEAYDSLAVFPFTDVASFLESAMKTEGNNIARSYAILSWTDVSLSLHHDMSESIDSLKKLKHNEISTHCNLSYCYALYMFGQVETLDEILFFLKNGDYHIRCATIALLDEIIDETNEKRIKDSIAILLSAENTVAVKDRAERFLKEN